MRFERFDGYDQHHDAGLELAFPRDDIKKFFHAEIGGKTRLRDDIIGKLERHERRNHAVVAMRNIRERTRVNKYRLALQRLHEIGLDGIFQQHRHRADNLQVFGGDQLFLRGNRGGYLGKFVFHRMDGLAKREHRHDLTGSSDVKSGFVLGKITNFRKPQGCLTQLPVADIHGAAPKDFIFIDLQRIPVMNAVIQHRGQQIVSDSDGVDVAGKVQIDIFQRNDLRIPGAGRAPFGSEDRAQGWLAQAKKYFFLEKAQCLSKADAGSGLAVPFACGRHPRHADEFAVGARGEPLEDA